jgi:hypothetical protein
MLALAMLRWAAAAVVVAVLLGAAPAAAFYLPGVAPNDFQKVPVLSSPLILGSAPSFVSRGISTVRDLAAATPFGLSLRLELIAVVFRLTHCHCLWLAYAVHSPDEELLLFRCNMTGRYQFSEFARMAA